MLYLHWSVGQGVQGWGLLEVLVAASLLLLGKMLLVAAIGKEIFAAKILH